MLAPSEQRLCGRCRVNPAKPRQRWCKTCHAEYMRDRRKAETAELTKLRRLAGMAPKHASRRRIKSSKAAALIVTASGILGSVTSDGLSPAGRAVATMMGGAAGTPGQGGGT